MDRHTEQKVIRDLKNRVRELQRELCERTRNYLLHRGMKVRLVTKKEDREVQVETEEVYVQEKPQFKTNSHSFLSPVKQSMESSQVIDFTACLRKQDAAYFSSALSEQFSSKKQRIGEILQHLLQQQRKQEEQSCQGSGVNDTFISQTSSFDGESQNMDREKRRMKREIKKLTAKLQFQKNITKYAKEGLLISEEENYQFRLKIKELMRGEKGEEESRQEIAALKEEISGLQAQLDHERQMKEEYLENCLILRDEMDRLQQQNERLKSQQPFQNISLTPQPQSEGQIPSHRFSEIAPQVLENLKEVAFSISNCIPVTKQCGEVNFFKPDNQLEILQALKRVEAYCKNIERWQLQRIDNQNKEKSNFVKFIRTVAAVMDQNTKRQVSKQVKQLSELTHFLQLLQLQANPPQAPTSPSKLDLPTIIEQVQGQ